MNIKQLETFYWAAKLGSFTAAAERVFSTQSGVSMRIQELERFLGVALFDRSQRTARLTPKGREMLEYAERLLQLVSEMRDKVGSPDSVSAFLRLGVAEVVSITWLPGLIKTLHHQYPNVRVELDESLTVDLVSKLSSGSLDLILAPRPLGEHGLVGRSLGRVEFAWMASPALGLAGKRLGPRELQDIPTIALGRDSYHHAIIDQWFRSAGVTARRFGTCKSMGVAVSLTVAGLGISYLPMRCYRHELAEGSIQVLDTTPRIDPVEFMALHAADAREPLVELVSELASEISDFDRWGENGAEAAPVPA